MSNLVSKNPVLRFKLGRKIIKALNGTYVPIIIDGSTFKYNPNNGTYSGTLKPGQNISYLDIVNAYNSLYRKQQNNSKQAVPILKKDNTTNSFRNNATKALAIKLGEYNRRVRNGEITPFNINNFTWPKFLTYPFINIESLPQVTSAQTDINPKENKVITKQNTPIYNKLSFKTAFNNARNSRLLEFVWNGRRFNTMKAGETKELWLAGLKGQQILQLNLVAPITSIPMFTAPKFDQLSVITNTSKPIYNFNRSQTRQLMRNAGYNPYNFTGALRKALRMYLAGKSTDTSKLAGIDLSKFKF